MQDLETTIENGQPFRNAAGHVATFSTQGLVDLTSEYFQPQGSNGRSCATCHAPQEAWSITPATIQQLFDQTEGTHPIFNQLDANNPGADLSTIAAREAAFSMLLSRAVFRRGGALRDPREWDLVAVDDPHGFANLTRLVHWRRAMPTINFALGSAVVNWDSGNSVERTSAPDSRTRRGAMWPWLSRARRHQPRSSPTSSISKPRCSPPRSALWVSAVSTPMVRAAVPRLGEHAESRRTLRSVRRLDRSRQPETGADRARAGAVQRRECRRGSCSACHNSANDGTNINGILFDIGTASAAARTPDLPLYTFRNRTTGEIRQLTDAGRGNVSGCGVTLAVSRRRRCAPLPLGRRTSTTGSPQRSRT